MTATSKIKSPVGIFRVVTIVLGFIIMVMGIHSHYTSTWVQSEVYFEGVGVMKPYKLCDLGFIPTIPTEKCPMVLMERFFVAMVTISFVLSLVILVAFLRMDMSVGFWKYMDMGYHAFTAILLLVAAILYFVSAEQIADIFKNAVLTGDWNFRRSEKHAAAALTVIQALLYGVTAGVIMKS